MHALLGDKAFGMGNEVAVTHWIDISFGFVFNSDGTIALAKEGDPLDAPAWEPGMYDTERDYTYNDRFKVLTAEYMDAGTQTKKRLIQYLKQPGGQGQWLLLAELKPISGPEFSPTSHWFAQFAAKERGAALSNLIQGQAYSNMFLAPDTLSELYGSPYSYPADGCCNLCILTTT